MAIISFAAVFAGLGLGEPGSDCFSAGLLVSGVFLGSAIGWLAPSGSMSVFRNRFTAREMRWINRPADTIITALGLAAFWSLV